MRITLSFATTADHYLDDNSPRRLMISTPEDWDAVMRLRAACDASWAPGHCGTTIRHCCCGMKPNAPDAAGPGCGPTLRRSR